VIFYCANTTELYVTNWKFSKGSHYGKMGHFMKKVDNHWSTAKRQRKK